MAEKAGEHIKITDEKRRKDEINNKMVVRLTFEKGKVSQGLNFL